MTHREPTISRRGALTALSATAAVGVLPPLLLADPPSPWSRAMHSGIRLVPGGQVDSAGLMATTIQIQLDKGFKTYWRTPGDSGIPPVFAFDGSVNARDITVHFPAPVRFPDGAGGHSVGYVTPLVELPVTFRAIDPARAVHLALKMDYAVCEKICVPSAGTVSLKVVPQKALAARMVRLLAEGLPRKAELGATVGMAILAIRKSGEPEHFLVEARLPEGTDADLFIEGEQPWLFDSKGFTRGPGGVAVFNVLAIDRDKTPECRGADITLTLTAGNHAIETRTWLDVTLLRS